MKDARTYTLTIEALEENENLSLDDIKAFERWHDEVLSTADFSIRVYVERND